jgi:methylmalonyl-CoA mutase
MNDEKQSEKLFADFPPISTAEWMAVIEKDLKGADFDKALVWNTYEGVKVRPFYRREDLDAVSEVLSDEPGRFPYLRGAVAGPNDWKIRQDIFHSNPKDANEAALRSLDRGAQGIAFVAQPLGAGVIGVAVNGPDDLRTLLAGFTPEMPVHFATGPLTEAWVENLPDDVAAKLAGSLDYDPIADYATVMRAYEGRDKMAEDMKAFCAFANKKVPGMRSVHVRSSLVHEAGGSAVQELAFSLAKGAEYLDILGADAIRSFLLTFSVGSNFFMEIAKFRAARVLWARMAQEFGLAEEDRKVAIHARSSNWNKTIYDAYANMLRATTEAMSAAIGGADSISVIPYDVIFEAPDEFSVHIARNVQVILRDEAYLGQVRDVAGGSYYVETLTQALAEKSWTLFQQIEEHGGLAKALETGWVQEEIHKVREAKDAHISERRLSLIGTNQFPNLKETMLDKLKPAHAEPCALLKPWPVSNVPVPPITRYRAAEPFEQVRLATEDHVHGGGKLPVLFLLGVGNLAMRKARAHFIANLFGCAGFEIVESTAADVAAGVKEAKAAQADAVVLCSSDDEYAEFGRQLVKEAKSAGLQGPLIVAGYPKDSVEALKAAGIDDFVHVRSNALETLRRYQALLCR